MGRPSSYTPEVASEILERLASGESLRAICKDDHLPAPKTVRHWIAMNQDGFSAKYAHARDAGLDEMADQLLEIADEVTDDPRSRAVRVDARKWYLAKLAPKRYGDRVAVDVGVTDGLAERLARARAANRERLTTRPATLDQGTLPGALPRVSLGLSPVGETGPVPPDRSPADREPRG